MKKICIVTSVHLCYNPRVLKEADAFYAGGYDVTVVTINGNNRLHQFDVELMKSRGWQLKTVNFRKEGRIDEKVRWIKLTFLHQLFLFLSRFTYKMGIAERAAIKGFSALLKLATDTKADFYLAHHAETLAIASRAAKRVKARVGFDAEDFQTGMDESGGESEETKRLRFLETKYLPAFGYFTAASAGIGLAYQKKYALPGFQTILNVFPTEKIEPIRVNQAVRFYWYSQVIGPNRGLEILLEAAGRLTGPFELHIRGKFHSPEYEQSLRMMTQTLNISPKVFFHVPILAEKIVFDASQYDVGLAIESNVSFNRNICVTNKIFTYLMAGLAIVGSDTEGQKNIFQQFRNAVYLYKQNDVEDLKTIMQYLIQQPEQLLMAKQAARHAALSEFNWEQESRKLMFHFQRQSGL